MTRRLSHSRRATAATLASLLFLPDASVSAQILAAPFAAANALASSVASVAAQPASPLTLTVEQAIERALTNSHRVDEMTARGEAANAVIEQRHAVQLPRLNAQGGYTRTNHVDQFGIQLPNGQLRIIYPDIPDNYRSRVDAQWPLYTGGRLQALEQAARTDAGAATFDIQAVRSDLRAEVARTYWTLASQTQSIAVLDRSIAQTGEHLRDARNRLEAGLIPPNEVLSVEAQQARQQMLRIQANGAREVTEAALARLIGAAPGTAIVTADTIDLPATMTDGERAGANGTGASAGLEALIATARENRADRRALADRAVAATGRVTAAAAGRRPTIGVGGGFDYARPNPRIFPRVGEFKTSWDASINVDWPLFDGERVSAELAEASAAQRAAEARLAEFDSQLSLEIRQRLSELTSSRAAVSAAHAAIRAATEGHRVLRDRFNAGVATATDVLDAEIAILQAELDRTQAMATYRIAAAGLARATGR